MNKRNLRGVISCITKRIPKGEFVSSISFTGNSYIDVPLKTTGDYRFEVEFSPYIYSTGVWLFGGREDPAQTLGVHVSTSGVFSSYGGATIAKTPVLETGKMYNLIMDKNLCNINGVDYLVIGQTLVPEEYEANLRIFGFNGVNYTGTARDTRQFIGSGSKFKIYDNPTNTLLYDLHSYKDENDEYGFWCYVTNRVYYSDGPIPFTMGDY